VVGGEVRREGAAVAEEIRNAIEIWIDGDERSRYDEGILSDDETGHASGSESGICYEMRIGGA
jgi:hypothetical protein